VSTRGIPKHKLSRAAKLAGTGARVGSNYARYMASKAAGRADSDILHDRNARAAYEAFSTLRGGPLKVAQMLSIDENILPRQYRQQFRQAQYSVPALSFPLAIRMFKRSLGKHPDQVFDSFTREPVNAASIGQVHRATKRGNHYAVKIQYPGVATSLESDLALLRPIAQHILDIEPTMLDRFMLEAKSRLLEECDYTLELRRSTGLSTASAHLSDVHFPTYYPEYSGTHVITMDWMDGEPIDKWLARNPTKQSRDRVGQALWDFYHFQIHHLKEFHADPHPGNFLIHDDQLIVIDFGCVKKLDPLFHKSYFRLLNPELLEDSACFEECLRSLELLIETDNENDVRLIMKTMAESISLLGRPYLEPVFDFGDNRYIESIYEIGERNRQDQGLQKLDRSRGPAESLYINRTFFGLYSLLGEIGARIETHLPPVAQDKQVG